MATLVVIRGPDAGSTFPLRFGLQRIGRDPRCEIHLDDTETSRSHAQIFWDRDGITLKDLNSSNGTQVNGSTISEHPLRDGDRIRIGKRELQFNAAGADPKSSDRKYLDRSVSIVSDESLGASQIISRADLQDPVEETAVFDPSILKRSATNKSPWEIMYRTSLAVSRTLDIDQLLEQIIDLIFQWVQCDHACVMLQDPHNGRLRPAYRKNRRPNSNHQITISKTILDYVLKQEEGVLTSNAKDDRRWSSSASIEAAGICEAICVPMRGRYGMVGVLYIDTIVQATQRSQDPSQRVFTEEHLKMLITIGHQAALAIEDTTFYQSTLQAERLAAVGETIAMLSHHVKNVLQGLRGGGYMVQEGLKREELQAIRDGWSICEKTHTKIESLVLDLLTISKERQPNRQAVDLRKIIQDVLSIASVSANEQQVTLVWNPPDQLPDAWCDAEGLHRAILNLVVNAIDATEEKPERIVTIRLGHQAAKEDRIDFTITVEDNGAGIDEADFDRIFSLFESTKGNRGTGLGLPVTQKIIREHGGDLRVESVLGQGTTFSIHLPCPQTPQAAAPVSPPTSPPAEG